MTDRGPLMATSQLDEGIQPTLLMAGELTVFLAGVDDADDVRVGQLDQGLDFVDEAAAELGIGQQRRLREQCFAQSVTPLGIQKRPSR